MTKKKEKKLANNKIKMKKKQTVHCNTNLNRRMANGGLFFFYCRENDFGTLLWRVRIVGSTVFFGPNWSKSHGQLKRKIFPKANLAVGWKWRNRMGKNRAPTSHAKPKHIDCGWMVCVLASKSSCGLRSAEKMLECVCSERVRFSLWWEIEGEREWERVREWKWAGRVRREKRKWPTTTVEGHDLAIGQHNIDVMSALIPIPEYVDQIFCVCVTFFFWYSHPYLKFNGTLLGAFGTLRAYVVFYWFTTIWTFVRHTREIYSVHTFWIWNLEFVCGGFWVTASILRLFKVNIKRQEDKGWYTKSDTLFTI